LETPVHEGNICSPSDGIGKLRRSDHPDAARLLTDAFIYDPGWLAIGPGRTRHRYFVAERFHRAVLRTVDRHGGPSYGAFRDGNLAGLALTFAPGRYPPPAWTELRYFLAFLAAGPGPIVRGLRFGAVQDSGHPQDRHVYLWFLAVDPARQRAGVGGALLKHVTEEAEAPVYLDTTNPANVPYYASAGFEEIGRGTVPRDTPIWFMRRP
jgi:ribosomal protein S18 acetylase RimI-like enzyme